MVVTEILDRLTMTSNITPTPMERIASTCDALTEHYQDGDDRELRIAAKALLVALDRFRRYGDHNWPDLVQEYLDLAAHDPEKFELILKSNRSEKQHSTAYINR